MFPINPLFAPLPGLPPIPDPTAPEFRYASFRARQFGRPWSRELLVEAARAAARVVDRPLTILRFEGLTGIDRRNVYRRFDGGWNELVDEAGIEPAFRGRKYWTDERLLEELDRIAHDLGRFPTHQEFESLARCTRQTLSKALGPKAAIVDRYHAWLAEHDRPSPITDDPSPARYPRDLVVKGVWTRDRLIAAARTADRASLVPLSMQRFCEVAEVSNYTIYHLFPAGWMDLVHTAGIRPTPESRRHTDDDLLRFYGEIRQRLGRDPTANELRRMAPVSHTTYRNRFGGMDELRARYSEWISAAQP